MSTIVTLVGLLCLTGSVQRWFSFLGLAHGILSLQLAARLTMFHQGKSVNPLGAVTLFSVGLIWSGPVA